MRLIPELGFVGDVPPPVRREEVFDADLRLPPRLELPALLRLRVLLLVGTGRGGVWRRNCRIRGDPDRGGWHIRRL